jgi:4-amino-4-deoxy-L-arabinose transferase-like glycosyltransferase
MLLLTGSTLVRLVLAALLDAGVDEAYAMAVTPQWQLSWFDHPPMAFWWVKAMHDIATPLFGDAVPIFVLRLPFVLAFTVTSVVMFDLTRRLWGARAALWALVALTLAPFFLVSAGSWMVPDGPLLLFLVSTARLLVEILFLAPAPKPARERSLWLAAGFTLGLAGLSKYHAVLFALGALCFILGTCHRRRLFGVTPVLAILVAGVVASPVLIWNAEHGWVSFLFQSSRGLGSKGINGAGFGRAVVGQMAYLGPWTLIGAVAATVSLLRTNRILASPGAFLVALAVPSIFVFTVVPLWGGDALPHWQMPGWMFLLPILGLAISDIEARRRGDFLLPRRFTIAAASLLALAIGAVTLFRIVPPSAATVARLGIGSFLQESVTWRDLVTGLVDRGLLAKRAELRQHRPLVATFRWIEAARIAEALGSRATVAVFGSDPRGFAFLADHADWLGRDVLLIGRPKNFTHDLDAVRPLFSGIDVQTPIAVKIGGVTLFEAQVAIGRSLLSTYPLPYPHR